jgi:transcriptional regulator with XRE-family HTH domain
MSADLGEFLRAQRARIRPQDAGLRPGGRRRVPGLRRDELAQLAGVSVEYYTRIEQGRGPNISDEVLDALGRVLRLDPTERAHLHNLARQRRLRGTRGTGSRQVPPETRMLLDALDAVPALVLGRAMDVLAWNRLGDAVYGWSRIPAPERNAARQVFLGADASDFYPRWDTVAAETVAYLRLLAGRHPDDRALAAVIGELSIQDDTFRRLWAAHAVKDKTAGRKLIRHPLAGELDLRYQTLAVPGRPGLTVVTYLAEPGSPTAERLALLASWTAGTASPGPESPRTSPAASRADA